MSRERLSIVVSGYLGLLPAGGITWDYLQYPLGFAELGHEVFYLEDTAVWPIYQNDVADCSGNVRHLAAVMSAFGLADRWAYRDEASGTWYGRSEADVATICRNADVLVNVSCSLVMRDIYAAIPTRLLIDSDPMFTQIQYMAGIAFTAGEPRMRALIHWHTHHFTFGEKVGDADCRIPDCGVRWRPTRQPIVLAKWHVAALPATPPEFTTVMNWTSTNPISFAGEEWLQKNVEFVRFLEVPKHVPNASFAVAIAQTGGTDKAFPAALAGRHGWNVLDPAQVVPDWKSYQQFIQHSHAEFSVAKETYVKARTGWFSCRSACYLASGRPVVTQDTGWTERLPSDCGLLGFSDLGSAVASLERVLTDPGRHARRAREIAEQYFDSRSVLTEVLDQAAAS